MASRTRVPTPFTPQDSAYQSYDVGEDKDRINLHYDKPVEFMATITGDPWHVYSCGNWDGAASLAESQEAKLDEVAALLGLTPGRRLLDVGCGWGGPLTYFSLEYGVDAVGITPAGLQVEYARRRIAEQGANASVVQAHWEEFDDDTGFDVIHSDEVAVHLHDLGGFYRRMAGLLRPGGLIFTRELHYKHPSQVETLSRGMKLINEIFGATGNYRTIGEELTLAYDAGLELVSLTQVPRRNYERTLETWLANMHAHKDRLVEVAGADYYRAFRAYLRLARRTIAAARMSLDMIVLRPVENG